MALNPAQKHGLALLGLFLLALVVRLAVLFQLHDSDPLQVILGDSKAYHEWALSIVQSGDWIGTQTFYQSPLYPYFLAVVYKVFGPSILTVRILQSILGALACVALCLAARRLFNPRTGLIAGGLLAVFPIAVFFDLIIQKSALDSFLLSLVLLCIARLWRPSNPNTLPWALFLGLSTGLFVLNRENALPIALVLPLLLVFHLRKPSAAKPVVVYGLAFALVLLPVALRNRHVGGEFHLTTSQLGPNLYIGNNPGANGTYQPLVFGRGDAQYERQDAVDLAEKASGRSLTPGEVSNYWRGQVIDYIKSQPIHWAKLMARKTLLSINATELGDTEDLYTWSEYSFLLRVLSFFHVGIVIPLAGMGIVLTWAHRRRLAPLYAITAVYLASVIIFYVFARYRYPAVLMLLPFAAAGLGALRPGKMGLPARSYGYALLIAIPLAVLANLPLMSAAQIQSSSHANLGTYFATHEQPGKALAHLVRAIELYPSFPDHYFNLALFYLNNHQPDLAIGVLDEGLKQAPNHPELLRLRNHITR